MATLTFVRIGLVDGVEVGLEANLACTHLRDYRANCPVCANVRVEYRLPLSHPELKELSTVLGVLPSFVPLTSYRSTNGGLDGCCVR